MAGGTTASLPACPGHCLPLFPSADVEVTQGDVSSHLPEETLHMDLLQSWASCWEGPRGACAPAPGLSLTMGAVDTAEYSSSILRGESYKEKEGEDDSEGQAKR